MIECCGILVSELELTTRLVDYLFVRG